MKYLESSSTDRKLPLEVEINHPWNLREEEVIKDEIKKWIPEGTKQPASSSTVSHSCWVFEQLWYYFRDLSTSWRGKGRGRRKRKKLSSNPSSPCLCSSRFSLTTVPSSRDQLPTSCQDPAWVLSLVLHTRTSARSVILPPWCWQGEPADYASLRSWQKKKGKYIVSYLVIILKHTHRNAK